MKKRTKIILLILSFVIICLLSISFFIYINLFSINIGSSSTFEIREGQKVSDILNELKDKNLIKDKYVMLGYLKFTGKGSKLKAGFYSMTKTNTPVGVIDILISGKTTMKKITIIEGWTNNQIKDYLVKEGVVQESEFDKALARKWDYDFLRQTKDLEGYLYPDTYYVPYNVTSDNLIKIILDNFNKKLNKDLKESIKEQNKNLSEIIILASIIEKEVPYEKDRAIIAGIFYNRLLIGMPLQSDATINYITGSNNPAPTFDETRTVSPYNTYLNKGLPPAPISNPSISAIKAAIYPEKTEYFFYLNRQDTGETIFSVTYEEHLRNKQKYLK